MIAYGTKEVAAGLRTVRGNTLVIAEEIPEDQYDFVPAPGARSVRATLAHIALIPQLYYDIHRDKRITTFQGYDFGAIMGRVGAAEAEPRSKAQLIALLKDEGEKFAAWVESLEPGFLNETFTDGMGQHPKTRFENITGAKEHEMHHRAQLMLVQRLLGLVPHLTRERQARAAARAAAAKA